MREGLRLLEQRQAEESAKLDALRAAVQVGMDDLAAGRVERIAAGDELAYVSQLGVAESSEG